MVGGERKGLLQDAQSLRLHVIESVELDTVLIGNVLLAANSKAKHVSWHRSDPYGFSVLANVQGRSVRAGSTITCNFSNSWPGWSVTSVNAAAASASRSCEGTTDAHPTDPKGLRWLLAPAPPRASLVPWQRAPRVYGLCRLPSSWLLRSLPGRREAGHL